MSYDETHQHIWNKSNSEQLTNEKEGLVMKKIKKIAASLMAVAAIITSMVGINASAAMNEYPAEIVVTGDTGTLKNNTEIPRYGVVIYL